MSSDITNRRGGGWLIMLSFLLGLLLDMLALPGKLALFWPDWLTLILIYWCLWLPHRVGIATAWSLGLLIDLGKDALLGQHALALALVAYLTLKAYRQLRQVPVWQQTLSVLLFVLLSKLLLSWLSGMAGQAPQDSYFLLSALATLLIWPLLVLVLGDLSRFYRVA